MVVYSFDDAYMSRLRERDPATVQHFLSYFSTRLNIMIRRANRPDADEIKQETLLRVWSQISQGNLLHPQSFGSYVSAVCRQVIQEKGSDYTAHVEGSDIPNEAPGLEEMMKFDQRAFLQGVLSQMPERDREILAARFFGQHDNASISEEFGVDRDYLRLLMHRAIKKFGQLYAKKGNPTKT